MLQGDAAGPMAIPNHLLKVYQGKILEYVDNYYDNMVGRKLLSTRKVAATAATDIITEYHRKGRGAVVAPKGAVPHGSGTDVRQVSHNVVQILDGFVLNEKDMQQDPKLQGRNIDVCMDNIHREEDNVAINGHTASNIDGLADITSNAITTSTNCGAWNPQSEANDIYQDVLNAINLMDSRYEPAWLAGHPTDINYLLGMDSERNQYWKSIVSLFDGARTFKDFAVKSKQFTEGTVYIGPKNGAVAEFVVSENPKIRKLPMQSGGNLPIELYEWIAVEYHNADAFVKIATG